MNEQNKDESLDEFEVEISDLYPQEKSHVMSAFWQYVSHHRLQARVWMTLFIVVGVAILTVGVLSPFLVQVAPRSTKVPGRTALPSAQQSSHCSPSVSDWFVDSAHPDPGGGYPVVATVTVDGGFFWFQGQQATSNSLQGRCLHIIVIHNLPPGENTIVWKAGK